MTIQQLDFWFWNKTESLEAKDSARRWWLSLTYSDKLAHYKAFET